MDPRRRSPKIKQSPQVSKKAKSSQSPENSYSSPISWRIGHFDAEGAWGEKSLIGEISFSMSEELLESLVVLGDDDLYAIIDNLAKLNHASHASLFKVLQQKHNDVIHTSIIKQICDNITRKSIFNEIYDKMKQFETRSWNDIDKETSASGSKHHYISVGTLNLAAQKRLETIGFGDLDQVYSLRLDGKLRIFGRREANVLDIIWVDPNHEICKSTKKHT